jgi:hypothetical protein
MGVLPSISGESWFGVASIESERSGLTISHAHPEPNRAPGGRGGANRSLKPPSEPKPQVTASARSSPRSSSPPTPSFGASICQNIEWLACPPPLFLTAVLMSSGTESRSEMRTSTLPGVGLRVLLQGGVEVGDVGVVVLPWWRRIVSSSMYGSSAS